LAIGLHPDYPPECVCSPLPSRVASVAMVLSKPRLTTPCPSERSTRASSAEACQRWLQVWRCLPTLPLGRGAQPAVSHAPPAGDVVPLPQPPPFS